MALVYADRVQESTTTTGTGTYDLGGALTGFQTFVAGIGNANTCFYTVTDGINWEVGLGTVTDAGTDTLARTSILASSNAGAAVNWGAGTKSAFCTIPAIQAFEPIGTIKAIGHSTVPQGYLACDGSAVSRTTYVTLFGLLSTTWGAGDGSTTFNVPDLRGRVLVGSGTSTVTETQAAANFNTSDIITVNSNPMDTKPKWLTGMKVQVTTSGVLPTGISASTDYYVRRLSATTISLYGTLAQAMETNATTGRVNITATGSGNHTLTHTLAARTIADTFGVETNQSVPSHKHALGLSISGSGSAVPAIATSGTNDTSYSDLIGETDGVTNMPPSAVIQYVIKY